MTKKWLKSNKIYFLPFPFSHNWLLYDSVSSVWSELFRSRQYICPLSLQTFLRDSLRDVGYRVMKTHHHRCRYINEKRSPYHHPTYLPTFYVPAMTIMNLIFSLGRIIKPDFFLLLVCGGGTKNLEIADGHKGYLFYRNNDTSKSPWEIFRQCQSFPLTNLGRYYSSTLALVYWV